MLALLGAVLIDAKLDRSPPEFREIEAVEFWRVTLSVPFRSDNAEHRSITGGSNANSGAPPATRTAGPVPLEFISIVALVGGGKMHPSELVRTRFAARLAAGREGRSPSSFPQS